MTRQIGFEVTAIESITLSRTNRLTDMYVLSPYVWRDGGRFHLMLRCVPRRDDEPRLKMAEIWYGQSDDGRHFVMDEVPAIYPGPDLADLDGCEDPTVLIDREIVRVWYTGWNQREQTGRLMLARGPDVHRLAKAGVTIQSHPPAYGNPKEPTVVSAGTGRWRMFFEFARAEASRIGVVDGTDLDGPWSEPRDAPLKPRGDSWDCWHLSPGPVIGCDGPRPTMFYNGATRDAQWRIGWAVFDRGWNRVLARSESPLIGPEGPRAEGDTDIAFAASAVEIDDTIAIYYSQSDQHLRRALVRAK